MPHLRSIQLRPVSASSAARFPFTVPVIQRFEPLDVDAPVVFFVGENGSGKSTLLEGVAFAAGLPSVGSHDVRRDPTLEAQAFLGRALKLIWDRRTTRGFFLRAEDFFGFTKHVAQLRADLLQRLEEIEEQMPDSSAYARGLAKLPVLKSLQEMETRYGVDLDANSHGQSFLKLFASRFVPGGLYLLDEPEAALSPQSQLALLTMMADMVARNAQFIIATHSPIILGFPGARIYSCDSVPIAAARYEELDHVVLTREFLNGRERFLKAMEI